MMVWIQAGIHCVKSKYYERGVSFDYFDSITFIGLGPYVSIMQFPSGAYFEKCNVVFENVSIRVGDSLTAGGNEYAACNVLLRNCEIIGGHDWFITGDYASLEMKGVALFIVAMYSATMLFLLHRNVSGYWILPMMMLGRLFVLKASFIVFIVLSNMKSS